MILTKLHFLELYAKTTVFLINNGQSNTEDFRFSLTKGFSFCFSLTKGFSFTTNILQELEHLFIFLKHGE